jgi:hypothetical protein
MNINAPSTPRQRKRRVKPARFICLRLKPHGLNSGVVEITVGKEKTEYLLAELAADYGRGFELEKIGSDEAYQVNIDTDKRRCNCKGHERWGHCKHADGWAALIAAGRL